MIISITKNSNAVYYYSSNGGNSWIGESGLTSIGGVVSTYCSCSISGSRPFTICWNNYSPSTLNVRMGTLGSFENTYDNVSNNNYVSNRVDAVCLTVNTSGHNLAAVAYAGSGPQDLYFDQEANSILNLNVASQGYYSSVTNQLNRQDTIKLYLRNATSPYSIVDSSSAYVDRYTLYSTVYFSRAVNENHFVEVRTKNTIAAWSYLQAEPGNEIYLDLLRNSSNTYGNNVILNHSNLGYFGLYSGDVNQDGKIDGTDTQLIDNDANAFVSGYSVQDLNGDNFVDGTDAL